MTQDEVSLGDIVDGAGRPERIELDALFLANSAEVQQGLGYIMGAGWTRTWPQPPRGGFPFQKAVTFVAMMRIPWGETNREHRFAVSLRDEDHHDLLPEQLTGQFTAGRRADLTAGMSQLVTLGASVNVTFQAAGIYHLVFEVDGEELKRIAFEILAARPQG